MLLLLLFTVAALSSGSSYTSPGPSVPSLVGLIHPSVLSRRSASMWSSQRWARANIDSHPPVQGTSWVQNSKLLTAAPSCALYKLRGGEAERSGRRRRRVKRHRHRHRSEARESDESTKKDAGETKETWKDRLEKLSQQQEDPNDPRELWSVSDDPRDKDPFDDFLCERPENMFGLHRTSEYDTDPESHNKYFVDTPGAKQIRDFFESQRKNHCKVCNTTMGVLMEFNFSTCYLCFIEMQKKENWFHGRREYWGEDVKDWLMYKGEWNYGPDDHHETNATEYNINTARLEKELMEKQMRQLEIAEEAGVELPTTRVDPSTQKLDEITNYGFGRMNPQQMMEDLASDKSSSE